MVGRRRFDYVQIAKCRKALLKFIAISIITMGVAERKKGYIQSNTAIADGRCVHVNVWVGVCVCGQRVGERDCLITARNRYNTHYR